MSDPEKTIPDPNARSLSPRTEGPYAWQARAALEALRSSGDVTDLGYSQLVYFVGTVFASEQFKEMGGAKFKASLGLFARKAGVSRSTVKRYIREVERAGLWTIESRYDKASQKHDVHVYTLAKSKAQPSYPRVTGTPPSGQTDSRGRVQNEASFRPTFHRNSSRKGTGTISKEKTETQAPCSAPDAHPPSADAGGALGGTAPDSSSGAAASARRSIIDQW